MFFWATELQPNTYVVTILHMMSVRTYEKRPWTLQTGFGGESLILLLALF